MNRSSTRDKDESAWKEKTESNCDVITADHSSLFEDWYVAEGTVTINILSVSSDCHPKLILADGCQLTVKNGISILENSSLTIYAQTENGKVTEATGKLTAEADISSNAAGIGVSPGGSVTIHGGMVTANGGWNGAGIGGGGNGIGDGGTFSTGANGTAVIYAEGSEAISDQSNRNSWGGVIFEGSDGTVCGSQTLQEDLSLSETQTLTVPASASLTIPEGKSLSVDQGCVVTITGTLTNDGVLTIYDESCLDGGGTLDGSGTFRIAAPLPTLNEQTLTYDGTDWFSSLALVSAGDTDGQTINGESFTTIDLDKWKIEPQEIKNANTYTVRFSCAEYGFTDSCEVTVNPAVLSLTLTPDQETLTGGGEVTLALTGFPEDAAGEIAVTCSDDSVEVTGSGDTWKAALPNTTATYTFTASYGDTNYQVSGGTCTVSVKKKSEPSLGYRLPSAFSQPFGCVSDTLGPVDVNGAYQFRLTSTDGTPPVVELDSESFRAELDSREGNDYFWKIYAIGSAGETCNVAVNGTCVARLTAVAVSGSTVVSDTTPPFTVSPGGSYQFRLTADARPSMAAGSPSFTVEYVGNEGRDWFFKVCAVGNIGDGCGFYINRAPEPVAVAYIG